MEFVSEKLDTENLQTIHECRDHGGHCLACGTSLPIENNPLPTPKLTQEYVVLAIKMPSLCLHFHPGSKMSLLFDTNIE